MARRALVTPAQDTDNQLHEWRDAAKRVARSWDAWLAAASTERAGAYAAYVEALRAEELAADRIAQPA